MRQQTLAAQTGFEKYGRKTKRERFLEEMEQVVPWVELQALVEPHYPKGENGRPPMGVFSAAVVQPERSGCGGCAV
jgi:IS5 family transposase